MPTLSITVDNATATRVQTAYGAPDLPTLKAMIIDSIKDKVAQYEMNQADLANTAAIVSARAAKQAAIDTALTSAQGVVIT
jgi:hypothetical protein